MAAPGETSSAFGLADDDDPRIRRVYQRLRTLTIVAALTMGVGFLAVMSVIAYRVVKAPPPRAAASAPKVLALPADARVVSTAADGGQLLVTVEAGGRTSVHVFDAGTLVETGRLDIAPGAPGAPPLR
jgi:hypothetical protein